MFTKSWMAWKATLVEDPDSVFARPALEERLEELWLSMDVQTHSRPDDASQSHGVGLTRIAKLVPDEREEGDES